MENSTNELSSFLLVHTKYSQIGEFIILLCKLDLNCIIVTLHLALYV